MEFRHGSSILSGFRRRTAPTLNARNFRLASLLAHRSKEVSHHTEHYTFSLQPGQEREWFTSIYVEI